MPCSSWEKTVKQSLNSKGEIMGVSIKSPNHSVDIGYAAFAALRCNIAKLCPPEIRTHYIYLQDHYFDLIRSGSVEEYDETTKELQTKYHLKYGKVIDFLYASDSDASLSYGTCRQLLQVIEKGSGNGIPLCNEANAESQVFQKFVVLLRDCADSKKPLVWH